MRIVRTRSSIYLTLVMWMG